MLNIACFELDIVLYDFLVNFMKLVELLNVAYYIVNCPFYKFNQDNARRNILFLKAGISGYSKKA